MRQWFGACVVMMALMMVPVYGEDVALPQTETVRGPGGSLTFSLPEGWHALGEDLLKDVNRNARQGAKDTGKKAIPFQGGFYYGAAEDGFGFPYMMVSMQSLGRVLEGELKNYKRFSEDMQSGYDEESSKTTTLPPMKVGEVFYDEQVRGLWGEGELERADVGLTKMLMLGKLTERGISWVYWYAPIQDYDKLKPTFETMGRSIRISKRLAYKHSGPSKLSGSERWRRLFSGLSRMAIFIAVIALIASRVRKKK